MGKTGPDTAPNDGTYTWVDKKTGQVHTIPNGIDPGWAYNVGESAWGRPTAKKLIDEHRGGKWIDLDSRGPEAYARPGIVPIDAARATLGKRAKTEKELRESLRGAIGGDDASFIDPRGEYVNVNQALIDHILENKKRWDGREAYFPLIPELIEEPYEIWAAFAKNELTGKVGIRRRYVKMIRLDENRVLGFVAEAVNGMWIGFDFFRGGKTALNNLRKGRLVWGR